MDIPFDRAWLPYIYLYGVGGLFFLGGLWLALRSRALDRSRRKHRIWTWILVGGFLWFLTLHGGGILAALGSGPQDLSDPPSGGMGERPGAGLFMGIVFGYVALVLGFGAFFARWNRTTSDFFFGGRRFSWWLIAISVVATGVGSHSFLKYSAKGFQHGFSSSMTYLNDWFFMPLFLFGWLPLIYYSRVRSIPEYFEHRFSPFTRRLATIGILGYMLGYIAIGFLTMAKTLQPVLADFLGWDVTMGQIVWAVAVVSGIYITFGGQTAVIFTDLLQGLILLVAGFILLGLGLEWLGGFDVLWRALPPAFKLPLAEFNGPEDFHFVGVFWQDGVAGSIGFLFLNQGLLMRFLACRSVDEGRKAAAFNTLFLLPLSTIVVCNAGWIGRAISGLRPDILPPETAPDEIFTRVAAVVSSPGVFAFLIAAVVAALMSTVDTLINAVAAVTVNDIYRPLVKDKPDRHYLKIAMATSALATVAGVVVAQTFFGDFATLYEAHAKFHTTVTPPLVAAVFLGAFWPRFNTAGAIAVFLAGTSFIFAGLQWPEVFIQPFAHGVEMDAEHPFKYMGALFNLIACFSVGVLATLLTPRGSRAQTEGLTIWSVRKAREGFKGGVPNDQPGRPVVAGWVSDPDLPEGVVQAGPAHLEGLGGKDGDMVYLTDTRRWLGGLRSTHARLQEGAPDDTLRIAPDIVVAGRFLPAKRIRIEKEF